MALNLRIENVSSLPDGGPLTFSLTGSGGADIGRDAHLDWTLPDASRHISGKHCEIRFQDGGYLLYDVSANGTFLNGSDQRVQSPWRLRSGDRIAIGDYLIAVEVTGERGVEERSAPMGAVAAAPPPFVDIWSADDAAPPLDPREFRPPEERKPAQPDFLEWAVDVPDSPSVGFVARPAARQAPPGEPSRHVGFGPPPEPPPPPRPPPAEVPVPARRRAIWVSPGPTGPWGDGEDALAPPEAPEPQMAPPAPPPAAAPPRVPAPSASAPVPSAMLDRFARGAGLPGSALAGQDPGDLAERIGRLLLLVTDNVKQLLSARSQTKRLAGSSDQTMIAALDNNPLKFTPTAADALRIMLGPPSRSYLDADLALQQSFDDLKSHQVKMLAAMQQALQKLVEDIEPQAIEEGLGKPAGLAGRFGSRRSQAWTLYEERWKAKTSRHGGGLHELFMQYFADCYDKAPGGAADRNRAGRS